MYLPLHVVSISIYDLYYLITPVLLHYCPLANVRQCGCGCALENG